MDATMAREQLRELNDQLRSLDDEREVLLSLVNGYNGWLRLHGEKAESAAAKPRVIQKGSHTPTGDISLRKAVLRVLQDAHGEPVHIREILARITAMGAITTAKSPEKVIDLVAYGLKKRSGEPIERVSPRQWRYTGKTNGTRP